MYTFRVAMRFAWDYETCSVNKPTSYSAPLNSATNLLLQVHVHRHQEACTRPTEVCLTALPDANLENFS